MFCTTHAPDARVVQRVFKGRERGENGGGQGHAWCVSLGWVWRPRCWVAPFFLTPSRRSTISSWHPPPKLPRSHLPNVSLPVRVASSRAREERIEEDETEEGQKRGWEGKREEKGGEREKNSGMSLKKENWNAAEEKVWWLTTEREKGKCKRRRGSPPPCLGKESRRLPIAPRPWIIVRPSSFHSSAFPTSQFAAERWSISARQAPNLARSAKRNRRDERKRGEDEGTKRKASAQRRANPRG